MKQVIWMTAACAASGRLAAGLTDRPVEILLGMAGPLVAAAATWLAVERTWRIDPSRVTRLLMGALFAKLLFFGVYTVAVAQIGGIDLATYAIAFLAYFAGLYAVQGLLLHRLSAPRTA